MKTIKQLFMLLALVGVFTTSCEKDEVKPKDPFDTLDFQVSPEDAGINEKVDFTANNATLGDVYEYKLVGGDLDVTVVAENGIASYKFDTEGSYKVTLSVDGKLAKAEHMVDVSASNYKSAKKLYISTLTNIFEVDMSADVLTAEDTDLKAGKNALTVKWANDKLYIFDAGVRVGYSVKGKDYTDEAGSIKTFDPASFSTSTLITFTDRAYDDAFYGYVDGSDVYWANRNFTITKISIDSKDKVFSYDNTVGTDGDNGEYNNEDEYPSFITGLDMNAMFGIPSYAYNGGIDKIGDKWYIGVTHAAGGLYIVNDDAGQLTADRAILQSYNVATFAIVGDKIFFVHNREQGINGVGVYVCDLNGENVQLIDGSKGKEIASADVHATIIADEEAGYVYWTYRADLNVNPDDKAGIKSFPITYSDDGDLSDEVTLIVEVSEPLGLALAPVYE